MAYVSNHKAGAQATRARENPNLEQVASGPFRPSDFDLTGLEEKKQDEEEDGVRASKKGSNWTFSIPKAHIRHAEFVFEEYAGQSLAVNQVEVKAGEKLLVPTEADILAMSENDRSRDYRGGRGGGRLHRRVRAGWGEEPPPYQDPDRYLLQRQDPSHQL